MSQHCSVVIMPIGSSSLIARLLRGTSTLGRPRGVRRSPWSRRWPPTDPSSVVPGRWGAGGAGGGFFGPGDGGGQPRPGHGCSVGHVAVQGVAVLEHAEDRRTLAGRVDAVVPPALVGSSGRPDLRVEDHG